MSTMSTTSTTSSKNFWIARQKEEEAAEKAVLDKIEAARSTYNDESPYHWRSLLGEDSRQDDYACHRANMLDVLIDEDDGMLGMLYEIRDMLTPEIQHQSLESGTRDAPIAVEKESALTCQKDTANQFVSAWHHIEVSTKARMAAIDQDDASMLAMFREVGTATYTELSSGSQQLSDLVMANMRVALEFAQNIGKNASLLAAEVVSPRPALESKELAGDLSMAAMLRPEEWDCGYGETDLHRVRALQRTPESLKSQ